jgi:hypothetical protein
MKDAVSWKIPSLVHNRTLLLDRFFFAFPKAKDIRAIRVQYSITCVEAPDIIEGLLHFELAEA